MQPPDRSSAASRAPEALDPAIFEVHPAPTVIVDGDVRILAANGAARALLGHARDGAALLMKRGGEVLHCLHAEGAGGCGRQPFCQDCLVRRSVRDALTTGAPHRSTVPMQLRREHGVVDVVVRVSAAPLDHDGTRHVVLTIEDVSDVARLQGDHARAEQASREHATLYRSLFDLAPSGVVLLDEDGRVLELNEQAHRQLGYAREELDQLHVSDIDVDLSREAFRRHFAQALELGRLEREARHRTRSGELRDVLARTRAVWIGGRQRLVCVWQDITDRKRAEEALRLSERRYRDLVRLSPDAVLVNRGDRIEFANPAAMLLFGAAAPADLLGKSPYTLFHPDCHEDVRRRIALLQQGCAVPLLEERIVRLDGEIRHVEVAAAPFDDQDGRAIKVILRDATDRKRAEEALRRSEAQLRALAARLDAVREEEKARIARDLHDEMGQLLTALRIDLERLEDGLGDLPAEGRIPELLERAVGASELAEKTVESMQRVAAALRPSALDRLGLGAALRQECRRFAERTGLACEVCAPEERLGLQDELATALFRIAQEALTNVARHAAATRVTVSLALGGEAVTLQVEDDGRGLDPAGVPPRSLGILGMRERAERLGGTLDVGPGARGGTLVSARLHVPPSAGGR